MSSFITFLSFVILSFIQLVNSKLGNLTDTSICKVSHLGLEYGGHVGKTESGVRCQLWQTNTPVHKIDESFTDEKFPEFSRKLAKNYCRNPNRDLKGPWCYTMDSMLIDETCGLPLCIYSECRDTGPGIEYGGEHNRAASDRKCLKWNKARGKIKQNGGFIKIDKFPKERFPDENVANAKKYCRNPDGDVGGPWCFVEIEDSDEVEREYCDIPFCDDEDCTVFTRNTSVYNHFGYFNFTLTNLSFGLKIWDSDSYFQATARLLLAFQPLPLTGKQFEDAGIGIEISISNKESALTFGNKDKPEFEASIGALKSTEYTFFSLSWSSGFITLSKEGENKPIFLAEYKTKKNLLGLFKDKFYFYSASGTNVLWSFPFCDDFGFCAVYVTSLLDYQNFWPLRQASVGYDLQFYVRAFHSAHILLVASPPLNYPRVEIMLSKLDNFTRIISTEYEGAPKNILKEIILSDLLDFWKFNEFSITLFADTLQLYSTKIVGTHMIVEIKNEVIRKMRWFSPGSDNSQAHWSFFCKPLSIVYPSKALPPQCALNENEADYTGSQSVTSKGYACLPWSAKKLLPKEAADLPFDDKLRAMNFCRDPKNEHKGTYCYVAKYDPGFKIEKEYCKVRKCKSAECRMAGTGNDYIGKLSRTRSNRTCRNWVEVLTNTTMAEFLNGSLYPDTSAERARNFCRNPTRSMAGSWCFTTDLTVPEDACNVRDCDMLEECTILVRGGGEGRDVYILPQWKETGMHGGIHFSLKEWNPDRGDGIIFEMKSLKRDQTMKLIIGANNNEKVIMYYGTELVKQKTLPHLIPSGKWISFWLQIRKGEAMLGYKGIPDPLFEWKHDNPSAVFEPVFLTYMSINGNPIGIFFKCDDCQSEVTSVKYFNRIMPIGLWFEKERPFYNNFTLNARGTGMLILPLMVLPAASNYYAFMMDGTKNTLMFIHTENRLIRNLANVQLKEPIFRNNSWTKFFISFTESNINVTRNNSLVFSYVSRTPMVFYWFAIGAGSGEITWTANCDPPDIDGKPLDGGWSHWSPWQCTVSCGGGEGFRTRTCSNPRPNIFGKLCEGPPTSTGICNDFECGDISPDTLEKIRATLQTEHFSLIVKEGDAVELENNRKILNLIATESPEAYYEWTLNGIYISAEDNRIEFRNDNIFIKKAEVSDIGVYVCMVYRINKQRVILRVISLAVTTDYYRISTRATLELTFESNAIVLGYIYSDLRQKWMLNDTIYIDYGITTLAAVGAEHLKPLNMSHTGIWKCVVEQTDLGLSWITNVIKIQVKKAPNIYTHLMEDELTAPLFAWLKTDKNVLVAIIFIAVFVCVLVILGVFVYFKFCTLPVRNAPI